MERGCERTCANPQSSRRLLFTLVSVVFFDKRHLSFDKCREGRNLLLRITLIVKYSVSAERIDLAGQGRVLARHMSLDIGDAAIDVAELGADVAHRGAGPRPHRLPE